MCFQVQVPAYSGARQHVAVTYLQVTVILKHMFRPEEFEIEPELKEALAADITSECTKLGKIEKARQHA